MHISRLLKTIAQGVFAIEEQEGRLYLDWIQSVLDGKANAGAVEDQIEKNKALNCVSILTPNGDSYRESHSSVNIEPGSCFMMAVRGPLMKETDCGIPGTAEIADDITQAMRNPNIGSVLMIIDSPGGQVDGTFELADTLADLQKQTGKPILVWVDGKAGSGGYVLAAQGREIWVSHKAASVGSIGVMWGTRKSDAGRIIVVASTSPDKNAAALEAENGKPERIQQELLDPLHVIFKDTVISGRPGISAEALTGKMYLGQRAKELNMIDGICTLEQAVNRCFELANSITT